MACSSPPGITYTPEFKTGVLAYAQSTVHLHLIFHWDVHRLHAHVFLTVLTLLLEHLAEQACGHTGRSIRGGSQAHQTRAIVGPQGGEEERGLRERPGAGCETVPGTKPPSSWRRSASAPGSRTSCSRPWPWGVPVVDSPLAADGLRTEEGEVPPLSVASTREEYAELVVQRLDEARQDRAPDVAGRAYVERYFDWARGAAKFERVMTALVGKGAR